MVTHILIFFAAMFSAVMSLTKTKIAWQTSIFHGMKPSPSFWCDEISTVGFLPFTKYKPNCWHISQSLMYICFLSAIFLYEPFFVGQLFLFYVKETRVCIDYNFISLSIVLISTFNLFYKDIFIKKNKPKL